jgi:hypothetical protein
MFTLMALDVVSTLDSGSAGEEKRFQLFLARIRAWQNFMRRGPDTTLGPEAEIGLFGELAFLRSVIEGGVPPDVAVESWLGPTNGVQDFALGTGSVEVKTTIAKSGFPATIALLEQLDDSARQPLFLAAVRIRLDSSGISLPEMIFEIRAMLVNNSVSCNSFDIKLLHAGYLDAMSEHYKRTFVLTSTKILHVTEDFPRLIRANVPRQVLQARYELDIDGIEADVVDVGGALQQLGAM